MVCNKKDVLKEMGGYNYHVTIVWLMVCWQCDLLIGTGRTKNNVRYAMRHYFNCKLTNFNKFQQMEVKIRPGRP